MKPAPRSPETRRKAPRILLALLSAAAVVCLSQCKLAPDAITGVHRSENSQAKGAQSSPGQCISGCSHTANESTKQENDLHKENVDNCEGDATCLANEEARHEAAVAAIQEARRACMNSCHTQGGARGGR